MTESSRFESRLGILRRLLNPAPLALSQHSATFLSGGLMMVFGGRGAASHQCYLAEVLSYDVACDKWGYLPILRKPFQTDLARFGHSAVTSRGLLYIYGGFDGQMKADILKFTPGRCENVTTLGECLNSRLGVKCVWTTEQTCSTITDMPGDPTASAHGGNYLGDDHTVTVTLALRPRTNAPGVETNAPSASVRAPTRSVNRLKNSHSANEANDHCEGKSTIKCSKWSNCKSCLAQEHCVWDQYGCQDIADGFKKETQACPAACSEHSTCTECTLEECMWCESKKRCVESIAEQLIFPYGECPIWTTDTSRCPRQNQEWCKVHLTCSNCTSDPACGWCDDSSGTGMGACLSGGYSLKTAANRGRCSNKRWSFTHCKICQCNGHSRCIEDTDTCEQCDHMTQGVHCEACAPGFYGNALNGGHCRPCDCATDGAGCHPLTGQCFCATKGVIGEQCDQCDTDNSFLNGTSTCYCELEALLIIPFGGKQSRKRHCVFIHTFAEKIRTEQERNHVTSSKPIARFHFRFASLPALVQPVSVWSDDLQVNAPFVFNSSEDDEGQYERFSQINFVSTPMTDDLPMTFTITSSNNVKVNLTFKSGSGSERQANSFELGPHQPQYNFSFPVRVGKEFKIESFYVYLFDVSHPVDLEVSFMQHLQLGVQGDYYMTIMIGVGRLIVQSFKTPLWSDDDPV
uniref:Laminin EGF-like domain-containing protein n=1 Tax=Timema cristinae TaxID=61476 RepID=A0A7R9CDE1_TIMCR|nr:unnamed protein product [Timema cristinae]